MGIRDITRALVKPFPGNMVPPVASDTSEQPRSHREEKKLAKATRTGVS